MEKVPLRYPPMESFMFYFWWGLAALLMLAELLLPGMVVVFVGLGAATVALCMHLQYVENVTAQFLLWFISSLVYCFTLRLLVLRFYKSDTKKQNLNEDELVAGQTARVVEEIPGGGLGRIYHADTTWQAKSRDGKKIGKDEKVKIISRENITLIVERI